ncbi:MAG: aminotransferase class V-fold PLP-dependent enzyme [Deltaproteobacteria bacterium]|nr:aminotransferase class V-fold PLP-dependent enzyme [Deltaproteobacteria bacterium]
MNFDKSAELFPSTREMTFLGHCSISPFYARGADLAVELIRDQQRRGGAAVIDAYLEQLDDLKRQTAKLLRTSPENIAAVKNTSDGISMVANGYPFSPGDEVISFVQEYPANFHPWRLQELQRGVKLKLLPNVPAGDDLPDELIGGWSIDDLERLISPRTRVIALSHVQFTSGYAADLNQLGELCRQHGIDLVIDAAQSLGVQPIFPEIMNIGAIAASGWKWLMGPVGTGLFYTSPQLRDKLSVVQVGAETMVQSFDFSNLDWNPQPSARRFEFSTSPISLLGGLARTIGEVHARYGSEAIFAEVQRLQALLLKRLEGSVYRPLRFSAAHRSGILALYCENLERVVARLAQRKIICAPRGGVLRVAPHFYNTETQIDQLADALLEIALAAADQPDQSNDC